MNDKPLKPGELFKKNIMAQNPKTPAHKVSAPVGAPTKRDEFMKLVKSMRQTITDMQLRPQAAQVLNDSLDQIVKATDG